jgi:hypothetical protein
MKYDALEGLTNYSLSREPEYSLEYLTKQIGLPPNSLIDIASIDKAGRLKALKYFANKYNLEGKCLDFIGSNEPIDCPQADNSKIALNAFFNVTDGDEFRTTMIMIQLLKGDTSCPLEEYQGTNLNDLAKLMEEFVDTDLLEEIFDKSALKKTPK